jgi:gamma-glutamyltranspeptidase/glutathione hydrolase
VERTIAPEIVRGLEARGHRVQTQPSIVFGGAQLIYRLDEGGYVAGSDHRKDGHAVVF